MNASIAEALNLALWHHQQGNLAQAESIYRDILRADSHQALVWNLLGVLFGQRDRHELAIEYIRQAVALDSSADVYHCNLAFAFSSLGQLRESVASYRQAVRINPDNATALFDLGVVLQRLGEEDEAIATYQSAVQIKPDFVNALVNLGNALRGQERYEEARSCLRRARELDPLDATVLTNLGGVMVDMGLFEEGVACHREALKLNPDLAEAHSNLGQGLMQLEQPDEALICCQQAVRLKPELAEVHSNLGSVLLQQGRLDEAHACCREALRLNPQLADAHNNLGSVFLRQSRLEESVACYQQTVRLKPRYVTAYNNLAYVLAAQGRFADAMASYDQALRLVPDNAESHFGRALLWLLTEDFARGWPEYEWRWQACRLSRSIPQPLWDGSPLEGRTILLHAEQGLGDTLQFIRYARLVRERGGTVICECQPSLARLLAGCPGIDRVVARGELIPDFDVHAPLLSLPGIFHTTLDNLPADVPYLFAHDESIARWRGELRGEEGFKVGIVWQGNPHHRQDHFRSIELERFAILANVPQVKLYSLQTGAARRCLEESTEWLTITDLAETLVDFHETAAAVKSLDLVIACDTAVAHLAGALGVPVWVAIPAARDWRWLVDREDSPWYPTMRLFRQNRLGDWDSVFARMASELQRLVQD